MTEASVSDEPTKPSSTDREANRNSLLGAHLFFLINFSVAILIGCTAIVGIVTPESPFDFIGGLLFILPVWLYAFIEWNAWYRGEWRLYGMLGILNVVLGGFLGYAVITAVVEGPQPTAPDSTPPPGPESILWFTTIGIGISCYLLTCGLYRLLTKNI